MHCDPARFFVRMINGLDYARIVVALHVLDRLAGPIPETPEGRTIERAAQRIRNAFPQVDFDDPKRHVRRGFE